MDPNKARDWIRGSLAQGSALAMLVAERLQDFTAARLLAASDLDTQEQSLDDAGRGIRVAESDAVAARFLHELSGAGARCLLVEDELARRDDPGLSGCVAFVDERVLRWVGLEDAPTAARLLRSGSSGYPLNAYVCTQSPAYLELTERAEVSPTAQQALVGSILAILTTVYDGEGLVAVLPDELNRRLL